jgi:hypothetical protein
MEISVQQLVEFIFERNVNNNIVALQLEQFDDLNDLFSFCIDVLCKGIFILIGKRTKIDIDKINLEQFQEVTDRMLLAGIKTTILTELNVSCMPSRIIFYESTHPVNLSDHLVEIITPVLMHKISFEIIRV